MSNNAKLRGMFKMNDIKNEGYFGFHSEYYIDDTWDMDNTRHKDNRCMRGYMEYSIYEGIIYFLNKNGTIIKAIPEKKEAVAYQFNTKDLFSYIAVNCKGCFLYDDDKIALFDFNGECVNTFRFNQKAKESRCIYIFGSKVYYSEIKTKNSYGSIWYVDMTNLENKEIWHTDRNDIEFDNAFYKKYINIHKSEMRYKVLHSFTHCAFLYANSCNIIAGFTCSSGEKQQSFVLRINMEKRAWNLLDCSYGEYGKDRRHIFGFNMLTNSMWRVFDEIKEHEICVYRTEIKTITSFEGNLMPNWRLKKLSSDVLYFFFDGIKAYGVSLMDLYLLDNNGQKCGNVSHSYETGKFYRLGKWNCIPKVDYGNFNGYDLNDNIHWFSTEDKKEKCSVDVRQIGEPAKSPVLWHNSTPVAISDEYKDMYVDRDSMGKAVRETVTVVTQAKSEAKKNLLNSQMKDRHIDDNKKRERKDIFCTQCGQKQPNGAKFCFLCGEKLWKPEE